MMYEGSRSQVVVWPACNLNIYSGPHTYSTTQISAHGREPIESCRIHEDVNYRIMNNEHGRGFLTLSKILDGEQREEGSNCGL